MADLRPTILTLRSHVERMDKISGKDFADLLIRALEDIDRRVSALEREKSASFGR
jgi:hypothetical protein